MWTRNFPTTKQCATRLLMLRAKINYLFATKTKYVYILPLHHIFVFTFQRPVLRTDGWVYCCLHLGATPSFQLGLWHIACLLTFPVPACDNNIAVLRGSFPAYHSYWLDPVSIPPPLFLTARLTYKVANIMHTCFAVMETSGKGQAMYSIVTCLGTGDDVRIGNWFY
jgi:hypothetical protein